MKLGLMAVSASLAMSAGCVSTPVVYQMQPVAAGQVLALPQGLAGLGMAIDIERGRQGRIPLTPDPTLRSAANQHAMAAAQNRRAWAFPGSGISPYGRLGLPGPDGQFLGLLTGETYAPLPDLLREWLSKPGSRSLLLDRTARRIGLAEVVDADGRQWVVVYFAE